MANKRMINASVVSNDLFVDMPLSAQCLYFHLNVNADDDGFVDSPKRIQRSIGACDDDLKLLIAKGFIIAFQSGVIVITHWKMHNTIKKDRYAKTIHTKELNQLYVEENKAYSLLGSEMDPDWNQNGTKMDPQIRLDKNRLDKNRLDKNKEEKSETFVSVLDAYTSNSDLRDALDGYVQMRRKSKEFTVRALKLNLKKLDSISSDDYTKAEIVNKSIERGWKGFFPLSNNRATGCANNKHERNELDDELDRIF